MSEQQAYPLSWPNGWPRTKVPQESRFGHYNRRPTVPAGTEALLKQLRMLGVRRVTISTNIQLRQDGLPYSNRREPIDVGVAIYFKLKDKPRVLACDKWRSVGENLYAIAKHIEALRGQERWGVGSVEQAFAGYAALPERTEGPSCWEILGIAPGSSRDAIQAAWRELSKVAHPDAGGSHDAQTRINQAREEALRAS